MREIAFYETALIEMLPQGVQVRPCETWRPAMDERLEDCRVYRAGDHFVITGAKRTWVNKVFHDLSKHDVLPEYGPKTVERKTWFGKIVQELVWEDGWLPTTHVERVCLAVYGALILRNGEERGEEGVQPGAIGPPEANVIM